jgi:hypothetical protein
LSHVVGEFSSNAYVSCLCYSNFLFYYVIVCVEVFKVSLFMFILVYSYNLIERVVRVEAGAGLIMHQTFPAHSVSCTANIF